MRHYYNYASVIVFVVLVASAALASIGSYVATRERIVDDLNRALAMTLAEKRSHWLTTDTIRAWQRLQGAMDGDMSLSTHDDTLCRHLTIPQLRDMTYMRLRVVADGDGQGCSIGLAQGGLCDASAGELCSDTVLWQPEGIGAGVALRSYARCNVAAVFGMSNQRLPLCLCMVAMLQAAVMAAVRRRRMNTDVTVGAFYGGLAMSADGNCFCNAAGEAVRLTPMQHRLMQMFFRSPSHCLSKQEICETLWPRKEDANETLYTLIRRLRPVLEAAGDLRIEADRGRAYRLTVRRLD